MMDAAKVQLEKKLLKMEGELKVANLEKENAKLEKDKADMRAEMLEMKARLQMIEMQKQIDDLKAADNGKADGRAGGQSSTKQPSLIAKKETTVDNNVLITIEEEDVVELKVALPKVKQEVRQVEISEAVSGPEKKAQLQLDKPSSSYGTLAEKFVVALGKENQPAKLGQSPTLLALGGGQQAKDQRNVMKARDPNKSHGGTGAGHSKSKLNIKGPKRHSCEECPKSFAKPGRLKSHKCRQGVNPRECKVCNKIFSRPEYIRIHMRQHTGEKPYGCEICGKPYTNLAPLKRHQSKKACKPADEDEVRQGRGMMDVSVEGGQSSGGIGNGGHREP